MKVDVVEVKVSKEIRKALINEKRTRSQRMADLKAFLGKKYDNVQVYNCRNIAGDYMETVYVDGDIVVDYAPQWNYLEIFGLTEDEYEGLLVADTCHHLRRFRTKGSSKRGKKIVVISDGKVWVRELFRPSDEFSLFPRGESIEYRATNEDIWEINPQLALELRVHSEDDDED